MVRSGELMKYPLAVVDDLCDKYGQDLCLGYDIMCAFYKTMKCSEKLGKKIMEKRLIGVVPAFHGHAHNCPCQTSWHPQYTPGVGTEDFETCERTFSLSNHVASTTCLATPFHWRQAILEHFDFNDEDKHALSDNFIFQNYRDALRRLEDDEPVFEEACCRFGLSTAACEDFLNMERTYFATSIEKPEEILQSLDYVETLHRFWDAEKKSHEAHAKYLKLPEIQHSLTDKQIKQIKARNRTTNEHVKGIEEELCTLEDEIGIPECWTPVCEEYRRMGRRLIE
ncbi:hypothetical protein L218DRAFT_742087 [Marasmius fiardii PR-910]|nr:hypothetical protein L218DRAFT_742087 [Marasmius fiardii PR-910]